MQSLSEQNIECPYCGERIEVLIDQQEAGDQYIEDCQVCCRPIVFNVELDWMGNVSISARDENETF